MKFRDLVLTGVALFAVYRTGKLVGQIKCFDKLMQEYGNDILEKHNDIIYTICDGITLSKHKTSK